MPITNQEELNSALNDPNELKRLIPNNSELCKALAKYPNQAIALIQAVLNNVDESKRLLSDAMDRWDTVRTLFPDTDKFEWGPSKTYEEHVVVLNGMVQEKLNFKKDAAYTAGAAAGALADGNPGLPPEIGYHVGLFLDKKAGEQLVQTSKLAHETAREFKENIEDIENKNKPKKS